MAQVLQLIGLEHPQAEGELLLHQKPLADQPQDAERRCISGRSQAQGPKDAYILSPTHTCTNLIAQNCLGATYLVR
jgi:hypothetical protein